MMTLQELEDLIAGLSRAEKAQVLQWVVRDLGDAFPGIKRNEINGIERDEPMHDALRNDK